ncbi:MAG: serine/threonine-protein kinase [Acidimicrobiales bacterium]
MTSVADVLGGRYRIVRLLGRGGMSDVYEAFDEIDGKGVAIKIVRSSEPEFARRLAQEARALESFEHPGLIRLLDVGAVGDQAYLVMELIVGHTLAQALRQGPLTSRETANLGARLADALAYVHQRGVVHRDVKPSNILLSANGDAWLGDFGIARLHEGSTMTATGTTMGTVSYMAPEQLEDHQVGPAADIWSLGIILLECLTGRRVYEGAPSEVLARRLAGPVVLPAELPVPWKLVLTGMLTHRPDQRLEDFHVAALLATVAYDAPWSVPDDDVTSRVSVSGTGSNTVMMPAVAGAAVTGDETRIIKPTRTVVDTKKPFKWGSRVLLPIVVVAAIGLGLYFALASSPTKSPPTTTTRPPVTTTTILAGTAALNALKSQVLAGETAGNLDAASGQTITQQAGFAQADYTAGKTQQAVVDLQTVAGTIASGVSNHTIGPVEGQLLQSDLQLLAGALNLSSVVTTTTTTTSTTSTTTTVPTIGNGNGNGNGPGNGNGNGNG